MGDEAEGGEMVSVVPDPRQSVGHTVPGSQRARAVIVIPFIEARGHGGQSICYRQAHGRTDRRVLPPRL